MSQQSRLRLLRRRSSRSQSKLKRRYLSKLLMSWQLSSPRVLKKKLKKKRKSICHRKKLHFQKLQ